MSRKAVASAFALLLACAAARPGPAEATPFADVTAFFMVDGHMLPSGVTLLCDGAAATSCGASLTASFSGAGSYVFDQARSRTITVENTTGQMQDKVGLINNATAYTHASRGVGVDDPAAQWAAFSAHVSSGPLLAAIHDDHDCATSEVLPVCPGFNFSGDSTGPYYGLLDPLMPGESMTFEARVSLFAAVDIPEPASAALLAGGALLGLAGLRRRST